MVFNDIKPPQRSIIRKVDEQGLDTTSVDIRNKRRLIRLIETGGAVSTKKELRNKTLIIGLKPDRDILKQRIIRRVDTMFATGLEDEVKTLAGRYGWDCEALKGVGYAQWYGYFYGTDTRAIVHQKVIKATLDLAKRQRTWLKRNKSIQWINTPVNWNKVVDSVTTFLNT